MCWTDRIATSQILKLKDEFGIKTAIATGTFKGNDVMLYAKYFEEVWSMDIDYDNLMLAFERLKNIYNIGLFLMPSWKFIDWFRESYESEERSDIVYFYLDAHFYDPKLPPKDKWVVVKELQALKGFTGAVMAIHDFDNGELGHLVYGDEHMGWNVVGKYIQEVNPDFHYYTNTKEGCDIYNEETIKQQSDILVDEHTLDNLRYANSSDVKKYRGILYATPGKLDLNKYQLREFNSDAQ